MSQTNMRFFKKYKFFLIPKKILATPRSFVLRTKKNHHQELLKWFNKRNKFNF